MFLEKPEFLPYAEKITPISRRILLQSLKGTAVYNEKLVRALAKHFQANLIVVDMNNYNSLFGDELINLTATSPLEVVKEKEEEEEKRWDTLNSTFDFLLSRSERKSKKSSKKMFEKGDRVKYIGLESSTGPKFRDTGRVIVTIDDPKVRNVGVRWDRLIPGGHSLSKACEKGRGYYVDFEDLEKEPHPSIKGISEMAL